MIRRIFHVGVVVSDLKRSLEFYCDKLGGRLDRPREVALKGYREPSQSIATALGFDQPAQWIVGYVRFGEKDDPNATVIDVLQWLKPPFHGKPYDSITHLGINRICLRVDDVDKMYNELKTKGVKFISPPQDVRMNRPITSPRRICVCKDPDGVFIEFSQVMESV